MAIKSTDDYDIDSNRKSILVTGRMGTGKSFFAATAPTPGFLFSWDRKPKLYAERGGWDYVEYPISWQGWIEFEKDLKEVVKMTKEGKYKTIVGDSTTSLHDLAIERAMQLDPKRSVTGGPIWNVHYLMQRNLIEGRIRQIMALPCENFILISHLQNIVDNETGEILAIEPLLVGQLVNIIPGYFEEVYCAFVRTKEGKPEYYLRTAPKGYYKARSEISGYRNLLPMELPNNYNAVMEAYRKAIEQKKKGTKNG